MEAAGIPLPPWRLLDGRAPAAPACAGLSFPVAVKALPEDADHKTELGLLALNVADVAGVEREAARIRATTMAANAKVKPSTHTASGNSMSECMPGAPVSLMVPG